MRQITVANLFELSPLKSARLVCGEEALDTIVTGVNIIEAPDVAQWLQGGEVLLTNLYSLERMKPLDVFIRSLKEKGLGALIIKIGVFVDEIPEALVAQAKLHSLPLIEIAKDVLYKDIAFAISESLMTERVSILKYIKETHDHFLALSLNEKGMERIAQSIEEFIGNPVAIYDSHFECLYSTNEKTKAFKIRTKLIDHELYSRRKVIFSEISEKNLYDQFIFPIQVLNYNKNYLFVNKLNKELSEFEFIVLESAINSLAFEFIKKNAISDVEQRFKSDLISDILAGNFGSHETAVERAELLGWDINRPICAVVIKLTDAFLYTKHHDNEPHRTYYGHILKSVLKINSSIPFQIRGDRLILFLAFAPSQLEKWKGLLLKTLNKILILLSNTGHDIDIGIGDPALQLSDIRRSYTEAKNALNIKRKMGLKENLSFYSNLGVYRLLWKFSESDNLEDYLPDYLKELANQSKSVQSKLKQTLYAYIQNGYNIAKTAKELDVHYKTISYRIEKIKEITGITFDNADELLSIQLGLKMLDIIEGSAQN